MNVAFLLGSLNRGGTETLLLDIFNIKAQTPFDFIGIYRKEGVLSENFNTSGHRIAKLTPGKTWLFWLYLWRLRQLLKREKIEIVHAQQNIDALYARLATVGLRIKLVQTIHCFDINFGYFNKLLMYVSLKICNANIFVSRTQQKHYEKAYKIQPHTSQVVVYNGINFDKFDYLDNKLIRTELNLDKKVLLLGMVGNFVPGHDQLTICRFLSLLSQKGNESLFIFIGKKDESNPKLYEDCLAFCENHGLKKKVLFLGSRSDVPALLTQLDAFFYASDHDTFGISVIEAIASGIPVFVNDWEVMKEITENGKYAILYNTKDENDLLAKFLKFLHQPEPFRKSALGNAAWARQTYSIQAHCKRLHDVYREVSD